MNELIKTISSQCGVSTDTAAKALHTVSNFVKEQYPLLSTTVDNVLGTGKE